MKTIIIDGIEYNLTPKVLFKKGDFVVIQETTYLISKIEGLNVTLSCNGRDCLFDIDVLKSARLWDITKDAKVGDVLFCDFACGFTFIYDGVNSEGALLYSYIESNDGSPLLKYNIGKPNVGIGYATDKNIYPATKEQCDLLFQKMYDAGYEWDAEKKELKNIEQKPTDEEMKEALRTEYEKGRADAIAEMQNHAWSEKDEKMLGLSVKNLTELKDRFGKEYGRTGDCIDWLKFLKAKCTWKPSKEQMEFLLKYAERNNYNGSILTSLYQDLKKLKG